MSQMQNDRSQFDPNDPRLTAYVLDELSAEEHAAIEQLLAASPEARAAIAEIRETTAELQSAFDAEPILPLDELMPSDSAHRKNSAVIRSLGVESSDPAGGPRAPTVPRQPVSRRAKLLLTGTVAAALVLTVVLISEQGKMQSGSNETSIASTLGDRQQTIVAFTEQGDGTAVNGYSLHVNGDGLAVDHLAAFQVDFDSKGGASAKRTESVLHRQLLAQKPQSQSTEQLGELAAQVARKTAGSAGASPARETGEGQFGRGATVVITDGAARPAVEPGAVSNNNGQMAGARIVTNSTLSAASTAGKSVEAAPTPLYLVPDSGDGQLQPNAFFDMTTRPNVNGSSAQTQSDLDVGFRVTDLYSMQPTANVPHQSNRAEGSTSELSSRLRNYGLGADVVANGALGEQFFGGRSSALPAMQGRNFALVGPRITVGKEESLLGAKQPSNANGNPTSPADLAKRMPQFEHRVARNEPATDRNQLMYWGALTEFDESEVRKLSEQEQLSQRGEALTRWYQYRGRPALQQSNTEAYEPIVENEFLSPRVAPLSTFGIDVDTASYSNVRRFLTQGQLPPPNAVRIEELLNYFQYGDPAPQGDKPFSVSLEAAACPWNSEHKLVRVGLKGKEIPRLERPASNLVYLIDVSGSMKDDNKLPLVKSGLELLVNEMTDNDRVAIVTYAGHAGVALESTPGSERQKILNVIRSLNAEGSTNGEAGLQFAYEQAVKHLIANGTNRVILCTDGDFNVGVSDDDQLVQIISRHAKSGVYLSIFGFGMGNLKDAKLEKMADKGNGHYGYVDGIREAQKVFVEEMTGTLYTIAKDVKVQIEFNPAKVGAYRLIGYENRIMPAQDFHNDAKDAGDIGAGHSVTALYEIIPPGQSLPRQGLKYQTAAEVKAPEPVNNSPELLTLSLRYKRPEVITAPGIAGDGVFQRSVQEDYPLAEPTDTTAKTSDDFRWSSAVAAFGMILRDSPNRGAASLRMVHELASGSTAGWGDPRDRNYQTAEHVRRNEFLELVKIAGKLKGVIAVEDNQNDGVERKGEEGASNSTLPGLSDAHDKFTTTIHGFDPLGHTAVKKGMSEQDARRKLAEEGFQLDPNQDGLKESGVRFRKPWEGGYHFVTVHIVNGQITDLNEIWNDP